DRGHRVLHVRDEGAAAALRPVDVARADAHVLRGLRYPAEPGAEQGVDVVLAQAGVGEGVARGLGMEREGRLVRQLPVLVRLPRADDRDPPAHAAEIPAHDAGRKRGSAISGDTSSNTTSTAIPIRIV